MEKLRRGKRSGKGGKIVEPGKLGVGVVWEWEWVLDERRGEERRKFWMG
jgi:hypothetical protein